MNKYLKIIFYQTPSYLAKSLYDKDKIKNDEIVKHINDGFIKFRNSINSKEIPENENPTKVVNIVEKILDFHKQDKGKVRPLDLARVAKVSDCRRIKILTPKQIFQRLRIALAQVKARNTSKNLLNEIRQIIYSLYREKEVTKKAHNNIMNLIKLYNIYEF